MTDAIPALGPRCVLGESPVWDAALAALFWVDINGCRVHRWDEGSGEHTERILPVRPGSIALTASPEVLVVAAEHRVGLLDWSTGAVTWSADLPITHESVRLNDGRVDRSGNFWVGSMHVPASDGLSIGSLFRIRPDWSFTEVVSEVGVANGLAFTPDRTQMYFADTPTLTVWRYALSETGDLKDRAPFVDFGSVGLPGRPDGGCLDDAGCYWIACVHGSAIARITPRGSVDRVITLPARRPTALAFGGRDLATLFVTSIGGGGHYPVFDDEPDAGRLFALDVGVRGLIEPQFTVAR